MAFVVEPDQDQTTTDDQAAKPTGGFAPESGPDPQHTPEQTVERATAAETSVPGTWGGWGRAALTGLEWAPYAALGAPADLANTGANILGRVIGLPPVPAEQQQGTGAWWAKQAGRLHPALNPANFQPRTPAERYIQAGTTGAALALTGGLGDLPALAARTATGAASGVGGEAARDVTRAGIDVLAPDIRTQYPGLAQTAEDIAGVAGGAGGGYAGSRVMRTGAPAGQTANAPLFAEAQRNYTRAKAQQGAFTEPAVVALANQHISKLEGDYGQTEIRPVTAPLKALAKGSGQSGAYVPLQQLFFLDDRFGKINAANSGGKGNSTLGSAAKDAQTGIRDFIKNPPPGSIHSGNVQAAADLWKLGDQNYAAAERGVTLDLARASGRPLRQAIGALAKPTDIDSRGNFVRPGLREFNPTEQQALAGFAKGTPVSRALGAAGEGGHIAGPISGAALGALEGWGHGGLEGASAGAIAGGLGVPSAQWATHRVNEYLASRALDRIAEQTRLRAPYYQANPPAPASPWRTTAPVGLGALGGAYSP